MDKDDLKIVAISIAIIYLAIFGLVAGISGGIALLRNGQREQITGRVASVEYRSLFGEHTRVTYATLGGSAVVYNYFGYHNFTVGETITVDCVNRPISYWFGPFLIVDTWGEIVT